MMTRTALLWALLVLSSPIDHVHAFRAPFTRHLIRRSPEIFASHPTTASGSIFSRALSHIGARGGISGNTTIQNIANSQYVANITIGGGNFNVILDTGSSDLWITGKAPTTKDLGQTIQLSYAIGNATGNVHTADMSFSGFDITNQAYLEVADASSFGSFTQSGIQGLAGLGPGFSSVIRNKLGAVGDTLLDNIFQLNKTTANYITFALSRNGDVGDRVQGEFTISQLVSGYENITSQPKLPVNELTGDTKVNQHWTTMLDAIIGPDGKKIDLKSIVKDTPDGKLVAVIDSGFTLPQLPRKVSDAIYGRVPGATYSSANGAWFIPCSQELNISFVLGGQTYPMHPMDVSSSDFSAKFSDGSEACVGAFQPITSAFSISGEFDTILGEGFLRSTYSLLDWGDFVDESSASRGDPYVQLLSVTNPDDAHKDFVQLRLNGIDTSGDVAHKLLDQGKSSPVPTSEKIQHVEGFATRNIIGISIGGAVVLGLLVSAILWCCCCRSRRAARKGIPAGPPPGPYRPLSDPRSAPPPFPMNNLNGYKDPYNNVRH